MSEQSQKVESGKDQYIFVYRTYQPITIKGKVQFTTKEGTILLQDTFDIDSDGAVEMAKLTKGYPFAFQVLGYLTWNNNGDYKGVLAEYRQYLEEYVYEKIWSELSSKDKEIAFAIAQCETGKIKDIRELLHIDTNQFNPYRKRLIKKGIVDGSEYGFVRFTLPFFEQFVIENYYD